MINNRSKMHSSNSRIKKALKDMGFSGFYMFPHTKFSCDYHISTEGFDMFCFDGTGIIHFIQNKTNKPCSKKTLISFERIECRYGINCMWISVFDKNGNKSPKKYKGKVIIWDTRNKDGKII